MSNELIRDIEILKSKSEYAIVNGRNVKVVTVTALNEVIHRHEHENPSLDELAKRKGIIDFEITVYPSIDDSKRECFKTADQARQYLNTLPDVKEEGR